jgi:hypothetical protein
MPLIYSLWHMEQEGVLVKRDKLKEYGDTLKVGIKKLGISLTGYNLLTFTPLDFIDPESLTNNNGAYPLVKVYSVGLNVTF